MPVREQAPAAARISEEPVRAKVAAPARWKRLAWALALVSAVGLGSRFGPKVEAVTEQPVVAPRKLGHAELAQSGLVTRINALMARGRFVDARLQALDCVQAEPARLECRKLLAEAYGKLGDTANETLEYRAILTIDPGSSEAQEVNNVFPDFQREIAARVRRLHGAQKHRDEWLLFGALKPARADVLDAELVRGLAADFGSNPSSPLQPMFTAWPKETMAPILLEAAKQPVRDPQTWGALRLLDVAYDGAGADLVELYSRMLANDECHVLGPAATRLAELGGPRALAALKQKHVSGCCCGDSEVTAAIEKLSQ